MLCLVTLVVIAKLAGYDLGYSAGLYAGSQTISASMGLATDAINRLGLDADKTKALLDSMPVAYAVSYLFGTIGSALVIALLGPWLLRINLPAACKDYEEKQGGTKEMGGAGSAWHRWELRAFQVKPGGKAVGLRAAEAEALVPDARVFVQRVRHNGTIEEATADTVLRENDVVAVVGAREVLVNVLGATAQEVEDPELLHVPVAGVDVYVTNKAIDGKTLAEVAKLPAARGVFLRKITRGATATSISHPAEHQDPAWRHPDRRWANARHRRSHQDVRRTRPYDRCFRRCIYRRRDRSRCATRLVSPQSKRDTAHALDRRRRSCRRDRRRLAALRPPDLRTYPIAHRLVHELGRPEHFYRHCRHFRRPRIYQRPEDTGRQPVPVGRRGDHAPLVLGMFIAKYLFRFHDALTLGIVSGARTTTASLGLICDIGKSQVPAFGYTVTYAVGNIFLTIWGMVIIMLLS